MIFNDLWSLDRNRGQSYDFFVKLTNFSHVIYGAYKTIWLF